MRGTPAPHVDRVGRTSAPSAFAFHKLKVTDWLHFPTIHRLSGLTSPLFSLECVKPPRP
jgi:hypothetical protein